MEAEGLADLAQLLRLYPPLDMDPGGRLVGQIALAGGGVVELQLFEVAVAVVDQMEAEEFCRARLARDQGAGRGAGWMVVLGEVGHGCSLVVE